MERAKDDLLNRIVRAVDDAQRRRLGIMAIADDPECIFRLAKGYSAHGFCLPDGTQVSRGDPVAVLHLWGERMPPVPPEGADLAWAKRTQRLLIHSMGAVAREVRDNPLLADALALGNQASLPFSTGTTRMLERLGFAFLETQDGQRPLARLMARLSQVWTRLLRRAYNAASLRDRDAKAYETRPMWMSRAALLDRYARPKQSAS